MNVLLLTSCLLEIRNFDQGCPNLLKLFHVTTEIYTCIYTGITQFWIALDYVPWCT